MPFSAFDPVRQICMALCSGMPASTGTDTALADKTMNVVWECPGLPLIIVNSQHRICRVNSAAETLFDRTEEQLVGGKLPGLGSEMYPSTTCNGEDPGGFMFRLGGSNMRMIPIPGFSRDDHRVFAILPAFVRDNPGGMTICESSLSHEAEAILDLAYDLVTVTDGQGNGIRASSRIEELFGIPFKDFVGHSVRELVEKGVLSQSVTLAVLRSHSSRTLVQQTKSSHSLVVTGVPVRDRTGRVVRVVNFTRDITDAHKLRKRIMEAKTLLENYQAEVEFKRKQWPSGFGKRDWQRMAEKAARVDSTVLITGESGVGKEVLAREIHAQSARRRGPLVKINCAAVPETLFESELFGHERGAFTGANERMEGLVWQARGGTLLLDEVSEIPRPMQAKLLHLVQDKEYVSVGGTKPLKVDMRIVAITNQDLSTLVEEGLFRQDLFYRLNVLPIYIPPLRQRPDDIPGLTARFLERYNAEIGRQVRFSEEAIGVMMDYGWPGNVRQLENFVERIVVMSDEDTISAEEVSRQLVEGGVQAKPVSVRQIVPLQDAVQLLERELLARALEGGRSTRDIGAMLGINQSTVVRKLRRYGLSR